ncbi:MAG: hypothetical protein HQL41_17245 [Alphaproteobacteria bacterium]|nr:hypothetical protein [Alphaproteobacteria bacterium]
MDFCFYKPHRISISVKNLARCWVPTESLLDEVKQTQEYTAAIIVATRGRERLHATSAAEPSLTAWLTHSGTMRDDGWALEDIADEFQVSDPVIAHQLENLERLHAV